LSQHIAGSGRETRMKTLAPSFKEFFMNDVERAIGRFVIEVADAASKKVLSWFR